MARISRKWGIQPHPIEAFKFSTDPELDFKVRVIVGQYVDPPANFAALLVATGKITADACYPRRRHQEFLRFLRGSQPPFRAVTELTAAIRRFTDACNERSQPFISTKDAELIATKSHRQ